MCLFVLVYKSMAGLYVPSVTFLLLLLLVCAFLLPSELALVSVASVVSLCLLYLTGLPFST